MKPSLGITALGATLVLLAVLAAAGTRLRDHAAPGVVGGGGTPGFSGHFVLATTDGRRVTESTYRGKWLLVYFGFTVCPDACPTALLSIGAALESLGPRAAQWQPLFITIDPARDTPAVMAAYLRSFDPRIVGLVGTPRQIAEVERNYRVYEAARAVGGGEVAIDHSSFLYVVGPRGAISKILTGDLPGHALADELERLAP